MNYEVGQVVYLLSEKSLNIVPALIVEEIVRKTINESVTEYTVELPDKKRTRANISNISSMIFNDTNTLKEFMLDNTRKSVEKLIEDAVQVRNLTFSDGLISEAIDEDKEKDNASLENVQNDVKSVIMNSDKTNNIKTTEEK
jgi:hypothetical protein